MLIFCLCYIPTHSFVNTFNFNGPSYVCCGEGKIVIVDKDGFCR